MTNTMAPKSLLRHKKAVSPLSDLAEGSSFHRVLHDDAQTRPDVAGMTLKGDAKLARVAHIGEGHDHVAVVGDNRKLVVFNLEEMPEMSRGQGVQLQRYRDGGMADVTTFRLEEGLSWQMGGTGERTRTEMEMWQWKVARGGAGRMPPQGFPRDNRF